MGDSPACRRPGARLDTRRLENKKTTRVEGDPQCAVPRAGFKACPRSYVYKHDSGGDVQLDLSSQLSEVAGGMSAATGPGRSSATLWWLVLRRALLGFSFSFVFCLFVSARLVVLYEEDHAESDMPDDPDENQVLRHRVVSWAEFCETRRPLRIMSRCELHQAQWHD